MYRVYTEEGRVWSGDDFAWALRRFLSADATSLVKDNEKPCCCESKEKSTVSRAAQKLLNSLDNAGFTPENLEKLAEDVEAEGEKVIAEVRSLGVKGMKTVGEKFVALGELLRQKADKE